MSLYDEVYGTPQRAAPASDTTRWHRLTTLLDETADRYNVPRALARAVVKQESNWDIDAVGDGGRAKGWFQLHPGAAKDAGIDPARRHEPELNIEGGIKYIRLKLDQAKGHIPTALSLYNRGTPDYRGIGDPNYIQNVYRHFKPDERPREQEKPGLLARTWNAIGPRSAEAATPARGGLSLYEQVYGSRQAVPEAEPETATPEEAQGAVARLRERQEQAPAPQPPVPGPAPMEGQPAAPPPRPASLVQLTPDMEEDEIIRQLGYDPEVIKKAPGYRPGVFKEGVTDPASVEATLLNSPIGGFARGTQDVAEGLVQLVARGGQKLGVVSPERVAFYEALMKLSEANYQQNIRKGAKVDPETGEPTGLFADPSRMVGEAAATPIPGLGAAKAGTKLAVRAGRAALAGGVSGAVSGAVQPVRTTGAPGTAEDTYWQQKGAQAVTGGIVGGVASPVLEEAALPVVNKVLGAARGQRSTADQVMVDLGERYKVRLSGPDVQQGPVAPKIENFLENVPGSGVASWRRGQRGEAQAAGTAMEQRVADAMQSQGWSNLPAIQRAAAGGGPRAQEAQWLLTELGATGNDPGRIIQASSKLNLLNDKLQADRLYGRVEQLAQPLGNMPVTGTLRTIDNALADVNKQALILPEVRTKIQTALTNLRQELTQGTPDTTYGTMRQLDSTLGKLQRGAADPGVSTYLGQVKQALRGDMDRFANSSGVPALTTANRQANQFYRERVVKYREGQLAKAAAKDRPDEIYDQFVRKGADRAREFYNGLDPKGQAAVRYQMVADAMDKALKDPDTFAPGQFVNEMDRLQKATGVFFRGAQGDDITNYTRLLRHVTHKGTSPAGLGFTGAAMGGGMYFHPATLLKVLGAARGLQMLYETKAGRALLLASGRLPPGSPLLQIRLNQFMRQMPRGVAAGVAAQRGREAPPEPEPPEEEEE